MPKVLILLGGPQGTRGVTEDTKLPTFNLEGGPLPGRLCGCRTRFIVFIIVTAHLTRGTGPTAHFTRGTEPTPGSSGTQGVTEEETEALRGLTACCFQQVKGQICDSNPRGCSTVSRRQWTLDQAQCTCVFAGEVCGHSSLCSEAAETWGSLSPVHSHLRAIPHHARAKQQPHGVQCTLRHGT